MPRLAASGLGRVCLGLLLGGLLPNLPGTDSATATSQRESIWLQPTPCGEAEDPQAAANSCLSCHRGIETIRCPESEMFQEILAVAAATGHGNRCVVCHGGNPDITATSELEPGSVKYREQAQRAHRGTIPYFRTHPGPQGFYPDPGSPWINAHSCGPCHRWEVEAQWRSLMMTEAGKIQGTAWGFGGLSGYEHQWGNYAVSDPEDPEAVMGTDAFRDYLADLAALESQAFPSRLTELPAAPAGGDDVTRDPARAAFTYIRGECQRCHLAVGGKQRRGDYRGYGCSACHLPYSNAGLYEGGDPALSKDEPGHPLVHAIQSTHDSPVRTQRTTYSGIPVETCTTCHNRGRRIGVSYQGLMETAYPSPWTRNGKPQPKLHGKHYLMLQPDLHQAKGFLCQDCHTSLDAHSPNKLVGAITGAVEIECFDCHGTTERFPWELPLGFGDEYSEEPRTSPPRGLTQTLPTFMSKGKTYKPEDGYLLSARGNPLGNVVRSGQRVKVYLASGEVKDLTPLRLARQEDRFSLAGRVAMVQVGSHLQRLECYGCHATWAPQCYGCHLQVDYTKTRATYDWVTLGKQHGADGLTAEYTPAGEAYKLPGEIRETRSYLRWEDPALAQNGEGRICPVIPGCQTTVTVVNDQDSTVVANHIYRIPDVEGAGPEGQLAIDMSPLHPHTVQKNARDCESCHGDPKALGYGLAGGRLSVDPSRDHIVELMTAAKEVIPSQTRPQAHAIPHLSDDWSRFVTEEGRQLQTVGHHFRLSRPLNDAERSHMDRVGICLSCHQDIPDRSLAVNLLHHVAAAASLLPKSNVQHSSLVHKLLLLAGWVQISGLFVSLLGGLILLAWLARRRRRGKTESG